MTTKTDIKTNINILNYIDFVALKFKLDDNEKEVFMFTLSVKKTDIFSDEIIEELTEHQIKKTVKYIELIKAEYIETDKFKKMTTAQKFLRMYEKFQQIVEDIKHVKKIIKKEIFTKKELLEGRKRLKKRGLILYKKGQYILNYKKLNTFINTNKFLQMTDLQQVTKC